MAYLIDPGRFEWNFRKVILEVILVIDSWHICCEIALKLLSLNLTDYESTLI